MQSVNGMQKFSMIGPNLKKHHWNKESIRFCAIGLDSPNLN